MSRRVAEESGGGRGLGDKCFSKMACISTNDGDGAAKAEKGGVMPSG